MTRITIVAAIAIGVLGVLVIGGTALTTYSVQARASEAQIVWNADEAEAYVAVQVMQLGWVRSPARFVLDWFMVLSKYGAPAHEVKRSTLFFRITPAGVSQHVTYNVRPTLTLYLLDNRISDGSASSAGDRFEPVTEQQKRRLIALPREDFANWEGWSGRRFTPDALGADKLTVPFELGGESRALLLSGQILRSAAIDLQRSDRPPDRLWSLDERFRVVGKSEYVSIFGE